MMVEVKAEVFEFERSMLAKTRSVPTDYKSVIELCSSDDEEGGSGGVKRARVFGEFGDGGFGKKGGAIVDNMAIIPVLVSPVSSGHQPVVNSFKQFWKVGDYEGGCRDNVWDTRTC